MDAKYSKSTDEICGRVVWRGGETPWRVWKTNN